MKELALTIEQKNLFKENGYTIDLSNTVFIKELKKFKVRHEGTCGEGFAYHTEDLSQYTIRAKDIQIINGIYFNVADLESDEILYYTMDLVENTGLVKEIEIIIGGYLKATYRNGSSIYYTPTIGNNSGFIDRPHSVKIVDGNLVIDHIVSTTLMYKTTS